TYDRAPMEVRAEIRRNTTLVVAAAAGYALLAVVAGDVTRPLSPGEAAALPFGAPDPVWPARLAMLVVTAVATVVAFRAWVRPAGRVAWAAAIVYAVSAPTVVAATTLAPGGLSAPACVAAVGFAVRWLVERDRGALAAAPGAVAAVTVLSPPTGVALAAALAVTALVWARYEGIPLGAAIAGGWAVGAAAKTAVPAWDSIVVAQLWAAGAAGTVVTLAAPAVAVALALHQQRWPHRRNAAVVATVVALALVAAALPGWPAAAVLPAYALATVAVGAGALEAHERLRRVGAAWLTAATMAIAGGWVAVQVVIAATS
ncbi:MAG TPA: hypothetical protein VM307_02080, partial [Egibacteraceae bacterium]|nr:hypothetical protein [Egibacteraceae bacterium]